VDDQVEPSELVDGARHDLPGSVRLAEVAVRAPYREHAVAFGAKPLGDRRPDAARPARDQRPHAVRSIAYGSRGVRSL
jgi:hypothetical protein